MDKNFIILLGSLIILLSSSKNIDAQKLYTNYTLFSIIPRNTSQIESLNTLKNSNNEIDFWNDPIKPNRSVLLLVSPSQRRRIDNYLLDNHLDYEVQVEDVQKLISKRVHHPQTRSVIPTRFDFKDYHRLHTIYDYLEYLAYQFPQNVKIVQGGRSYEGRNITGVYVSFSELNRNKTVFLEGGIHAREWISPATVLYILSQILTSNDKRVIDIAQSHDWYVFPVFNPDGYEYSHTNDRLWRKTRKPNDNCVGTDPNRNWGYHWYARGPNAFDCSETFAGRSAFSEPETKTMSEFLKTIGGDLHAYLSFHSFGQFLLVPYGYTFDQVDNYDELELIGQKAVDRLFKRYGTEYLFGSFAESTRAGNGSSIDWVKGTLGTRFVFLYELRARESGYKGFLLPPEDIIPTGEETLDSLVTLLEEAAKLP